MLTFSFACAIAYLSFLGDFWKQSVMVLSCVAVCMQVQVQSNSLGQVCCCAA